MSMEQIFTSSLPTPPVFSSRFLYVLLRGIPSFMGLKPLHEQNLINKSEIVPLKWLL